MKPRRYATIAPMAVMATVEMAVFDAARTQDDRRTPASMARFPLVTTAA